MSRENSSLETKSLRAVRGKNSDWSALAKECVAFANANGGRVLLGVEDGESAPPPDQKIPAKLLGKVREKIGGNTRQVDFQAETRTDGNGGQFIEIAVRRSEKPASTAQGGYFRRVDDKSVPITGENISAFLLGRGSEPPWESVPVPGAKANPVQLAELAAALREAGKSHRSVREKNDRELAGHYGLFREGALTRLGVLCVGDLDARARLPSFRLQCMRFDERGDRVWKWAPEMDGAADRQGNHPNRRTRRDEALFCPARNPPVRGTAVRPRLLVRPDSGRPRPPSGLPTRRNPRPTRRGNSPPQNRTNPRPLESNRENPHARRPRRRPLSRPFPLERFPKKVCQWRFNETVNFPLKHNIK